MSDLEAYRAKAASWLETMVPAFGRAARKAATWFWPDVKMGTLYLRSHASMSRASPS